jgi:hypothetical protein
MQLDCQNKILSQIIKEYATPMLAKELQYELRFRVQEVSN